MKTKNIARLRWKMKSPSRIVNGKSKLLIEFTRYSYRRFLLDAKLTWPHKRRENKKKIFVKIFLAYLKQEKIVSMKISSQYVNLKE